MINTIAKAKRFARFIRGFFPSALPTGMPAFEAWIEDFCTTYTLPTPDRDSIKFSVASMIMHLGPTAGYKSKFFFYLSLKSACAKQVAGAAFYEIKERHKQAEATAREAAATNDQPS